VIASLWERLSRGPVSNQNPKSLRSFPNGESV
jgi:hypothetical protein